MAYKRNGGDGCITATPPTDLVHQHKSALKQSTTALDVETRIKKTNRVGRLSGFWTQPKTRQTDDILVKTGRRGAAAGPAGDVRE